MAIATDTTQISPNTPQSSIDQQFAQLAATMPELAALGATIAGNSPQARPQTQTAQGQPAQDQTENQAKEQAKIDQQRIQEARNKELAELKEQQLREEAQKRERDEQEKDGKPNSRMPSPRGQAVEFSSAGQDQGQAGPNKKPTRAEAKLDRLQNRLDSLNDNRAALRDLAAQARDTGKMASDKRDKLDSTKAHASERISGGANLSRKNAKDVVNQMKQEHKDFGDTMKGARKEAKVYDKAADGWKTRVRGAILEERVANMQASVQFRQDVRDLGRQGVENVTHAVAHGAEKAMSAAAGVAKDLLAKVNIGGGASVATVGAATTGMSQQTQTKQNARS